MMVIHQAVHLVLRQTLAFMDVINRQCGRLCKGHSSTQRKRLRANTPHPVPITDQIPSP